MTDGFVGRLDLIQPGFRTADEAKARLHTSLFGQRAADRG
jgi:hypothetical protein